MFYYEIPWFCQDFKSKSLHFFKSVYSVYAARIPNLLLEIM